MAADAHTFLAFRFAEAMALGLGCPGYPALPCFALHGDCVLHTWVNQAVNHNTDSTRWLLGLANSIPRHQTIIQKTSQLGPRTGISTAKIGKHRTAAALSRALLEGRVSGPPRPLTTHAARFVCHCLATTGDLPFCS